MAKHTEQEVDEALEHVSPYVVPGCKLYTLTSGACVRVLVVASGEIHEITWDVARATSARFANSGSQYGIVMKGSGYVKALEVVSSLYRCFDAKLDQNDWREL